MKTYYPKNDVTGLFASLLQDKRVRTAILSDTKLSGTVANVETAINSASDPSVRTAYLSLVADFPDTTIEQVMQEFGCTEHEAKVARHHARLHGPGECVKKVKFSRQRMSVSQCKFLTSMFVTWISCTGPPVRTQCSSSESTHCARGTKCSSSSSTVSCRRTRSGFGRLATRRTSR